MLTIFNLIKSLATGQQGCEQKLTALAAKVDALTAKVDALEVGAGGLSEAQAVTLNEIRQIVNDTQATVINIQVALGSPE